METTTITEKIKDAWEHDETINRFCQDTFGKLPTIYIGVDDEAPPPAEEYPLLVLEGIRSKRPRSGSQAHLITIGVGVVDKRVTRTDRTRVYQGLSSAATLLALAEGAVAQGCRGKTTTESDTGQLSWFPIFVTTATITIEVPVSRGRM